MAWQLMVSIVSAVVAKVYPPAGKKSDEYTELATKRRALLNNEHTTDKIFDMPTRMQRSACDSS